MSNRKLEVIALLSKDRRFAELTASFNGLNLKQRFPGLSRDDQAEVVRAARRLVQAWQTEDVELGNLPAANADSATETPEAPVEAVEVQKVAGDQVPSHAKITRIERPRATAATDEIAETSTDKAWTNVISGSNARSAWPSAATMALLLFAVLMGGGLIMYGDRITTFSGRSDTVATDANGSAADPGPNGTTSDPTAETASDSSSTGSAREDRVEAIIARHQDKLTPTEEATTPAPEAATVAIAETQVAAVPEGETTPPVEPQSPPADAPAVSTISDQAISEAEAEAVTDASGQTAVEVEVIETSEAVQPLVTFEPAAGETPATDDQAVVETIQAEASAEVATEVVDKEAPIQSPFPDGTATAESSAGESGDTPSMPSDDTTEVSEIPIVSPVVETVEMQESSVEYEVVTETESGEIETIVVESAPVETMEVAVATPARRRADPKPYDANADERLVRRIQTQLKLLGFDPGPIDGLMGLKTYTAIRDFQAAKGLRVDGRPTDLLLGALISYQP